MKKISATKARQHIADVLDDVVRNNEVVAITRRNKIDALVIKFPESYNPAYNEITNLNAVSSSFDFLKQEPDLYTLDDAIETYV